MKLPGITSDGKDWLTLALDPFHDRIIRQEGLPDRTSLPSNVEVYTQQVTLNAPAGTAGNWSAHVFNLPFLPSGTQGALPFYKATKCNGTIKQSVYEPIGPVNIITSNTQTASVVPPLTIGGTVSDGNTIECSLLNVFAWTTDEAIMFPNGSISALPTPFRQPDSFLQMGAGGSSMQRVVGAGFEIVNNTAELYRQGALTVSRVPSSYTVENGNVWAPTSAPWATPYYSAAVDVAGDISTRTIRTAYGPPASIAEANAYPGTKTWRAAEGCYSVLALDIDRCDFQLPTSLPQVFATAATVIDVDTSNSSAQYQGGNSLATATKTFNYTSNGSHFYANNVAVNRSIRVDSDISSVLLTGLSPQSTFTITLRYIVEKSPRLSDPGGQDLVRLTSPSAKYDPVALEMYKAVIATMPVGVPSKYNPLGEYWNYIVDMTRKYAPMVSSIAGMLPIPGANYVAKIADVAGKAAGASAAASQAVSVAKKAVAAVSKAKASASRAASAKKKVAKRK